MTMVSVFAGRHEQGGLLGFGVGVGVGIKALRQDSQLILQYWMIPSLQISATL